MEISMYKKVGLGCIVQIFRCFGFRLCPKIGQKLPFNPLVVALGLLLMVIVFVDGVSTATRSLNERGRLTTEHLCRIIATVSIEMSLVYHYIRICIRFKAMRSHFEQLVTLITNCVADQQSMEGRLLAKCRRLNICLVVAIVVIVVATNAVLVGVIENALIHQKNFKTQVRYRFLELVYCSWMDLVVICCTFYNILVVFLCFYLVNLIELYMPISKLDDLKTHQIKHQTVCMMIRTMEKLFSSSMMSSLVFELLTIIAYTRGFQDTLDGSPLIITLNTMQTLLFFLKNIACSTLNEKEHINYILYMKQLMNDKPEITYGGIFPIKKTFVFTVAGTTISYAMVLRGL